MTYSVYIYYRVPEQDALTLYEQIHTLQINVKQATGITGRLLKKVNESLLWMEVYENVPDITIFSNALHKEILEAKLADFFERNPRKIEIFSE